MTAKTQPKPCGIDGCDCHLAAEPLSWWRNPRTGNYVATRDGHAYVAGKADRAWFAEHYDVEFPHEAETSYGHKRLADAQAEAARVDRRRRETAAR